RCAAKSNYKALYRAEIGIANAWVCEARYDTALTSYKSAAEAIVKELCSLTGLSVVAPSDFRDARPANADRDRAIHLLWSLLDAYRRSAQCRTLRQEDPLEHLRSALDVIDLIRRWEPWTGSATQAAAASVEGTIAQVYLDTNDRDQAQVH